jgi:glutamate/tyrosine decarboxylase-like PLP-dependent enzyme
VAPASPEAATIRAWLGKYDFTATHAADDVLPDVMQALRRWTVHTTHPRYLGLFNPTPTWWGVAGDLLTAAVNPQLAAYSHAPAAVEIERHVLKFVAARLGLPGNTDGTFTVGGAEANLSAVVVALTRAFPQYGDAGFAAVPGPPVLYTSAESHLAWLKIAHLTGIGRAAVRLVPVDEAHRLDMARLADLIEADRRAGRAPFLIVGTAGTTGGGAVDPLPELADLATAANLHFHVDAAWAGAVALSDSLRGILAGVERADSVTVDAHKWLSAPMGAGMFLARHPDALAEAFRVTTSYMPAAMDAAADPYVTSVQWSRRFTGLKVFLALAVAGSDAFAAQIERDVRLGDMFAERLTARGWLRINRTPLPVVCVVDPDADARGPEHSAAWHAQAVDSVVRDGHAWVSLVKLAGRPAVRLCVTSHRTTVADVEAVVDALDEARRTVVVQVVPHQDQRRP